MEMPGNMPQGYMFPSNAPVMYADMSSMQQGGPQVLPMPAGMAILDWLTPGRGTR